jgi:hypothetical protein
LSDDEDPRLLDIVEPYLVLPIIELARVTLQRRFALG